MPNNLASNLFSTPQLILANTSSFPASESNDSSLFQTATIFTGISKYKFPIKSAGRHVIRLYFYPFVFSSFNTSAANFSVSTQNFVLLRDLVVQKNPVVKEFSMDVTSNTLKLIFAHVNGSFAYVNAIEVVSVPDILIADEANLLEPSGKFQRLTGLAYETVARVNMGGPNIAPDEDPLTRNWVSDGSFLVNKNAAKSFSNILAVKYKPDSAVPEIGPNVVYGTLAETNSNDDPNNNFNVTWRFKVDPEFDFKQTTIAGSLSGEDSVTSFPGSTSSNRHVGVIVGVNVGAFVAAILVGVLFMLGRRKRKGMHPATSKTWISISTDGGMSHSIGSKYSNATITSAASNYTYRIPFATVQDATNNFEESWVIGIGGVGKVYKGVLNDGTKVAVKRGNRSSQ